MKKLLQIVAFSAGTAAVSSFTEYAPSVLKDMSPNTAAVIAIAAQMAGAVLPGLFDKNKNGKPDILE